MNPLNALSKMMASLTDKEGKITIPHFYDKVIELDEVERLEVNKVPFDNDSYMNKLGIDAVDGEIGYNTIERTSIRPSLDINGMWGGYIGEGPKTVLPSKANAKFSIRLVLNQDPKEISKIVKKHLEEIAPDGVTIQLRSLHEGYPVVTPTNTIGYQAAQKAVTTTFGVEPIAFRGGGSIPIIAKFKNELNVDAILLGMGLASDSIHSPNEHLGVFNYFKLMETTPLFYHNLSELSQND